MNPEAVDAFCLSLPGSVADSRRARERTYKVGGKMFAVLGSAGDCAFKTDDVAFEMLTTEGPGKPARYPVREKWVWLASPADLTEADLKSYLTESHRLATARGTRRQRAETESS